MLDVLRSDLCTGVAGAGTMGRGIAQVLAQCGARTLLFDAQPGAARKGKESIAAALGKLAEKGRLSTADAQAIVQRIEIVESLEAFAACQVVVEAIIEELGAKRALFSQLEKVVKGDCILASNTSSLSVTAMAAACERQGRVAGYHFFNPVPVMKIVEVVDGALTEPWVGEALTALAKRFGHTPVRCNDTPGFIVNHAGRAFVPESLRVLSEGVADFASIDRILVDAAGFRIGPFGLMDLVGLDVAHAVMKSMYAQYYEEPKYRPSFLAEPRVAAGLLGRKTGRGWYTYAKDGTAEALPEQKAPTQKPAAVWVVPELREFLSKFNVEIRTRADNETVCFVSPLGRDATFADTGPLSNPMIGRRDQLLQLRIGHHAFGRIRPSPGDSRPYHACAPSGRSSWCRAKLSSISRWINSSSLVSAKPFARRMAFLIAFAEDRP